MDNDEYEPAGYKMTPDFNSEMAKTIAEVRSQSANVSELMTALAKAQGEIEDIERDRTVTVQPRQGSSYSFKYATLSAVIRGIKKALSDNGIARTQVMTFETNDRLYYLTTSLHYKNQFISSVTPLIVGDVGGNQQLGSALTYMRRYALAALVGVVADEDDDGNAADGNEVKAMQEAVNKTVKKVAPDPIQIKEVNIPAQEDHRTPVYTGTLIEAPMIPDGSAVDWMAWGRAFMEQARAAPSSEGLKALEESNAKTLKAMEEEAPKMFTNLSMSLIKVRSTLEKKNG